MNEEPQNELEKFAQLILDNYVLSTWSSKYGLSPVEISAEELVSKLLKED